MQSEDNKCCLFPCLQSFCTNYPSALKAVEQDEVEEKQPYPVAVQWVGSHRSAK
jgi:hypothetical protein